MGKGFVASARENSYACAKCGNKPTAGADLFMQNLGTEENKQWISCTKQECFESQGGDKGLVKGFKKGKVMRTQEQKTDDAKTMLNVLFPMCFLTSESFLNTHTQNPSFQDKLILAEVLWKGASIEWSR